MRKIKRILPLLLAFVMCVTSVLPVYATEADGIQIASDVSSLKTYTTSNGDVVFEAEDATLGDTTSTLMKVQQTTNALNGKAVQLRKEEKTLADSTVENNTADISFVVEPDKAGTYSVWVRISRYNTGNSYRHLWLSVNRSNYAQTLITMSENYNISWTDGSGYLSNAGFEWKKLQDNIIVTEDLESIEVRIKSRDGKNNNGMMLDQFVVTDDADFTPTDDTTLPDIDDGGEESIATLNTNQGSGLIEAEDTSYSDDTDKIFKEELVTDTNWVLRMREWYGTLPTAVKDDTSEVSFKVDVDMVGTYYIWARSACYNSNNGYIWLSINGGNYARTLILNSANKNTALTNGAKKGTYGWVKIAEVEVTDAESDVEVRIQPIRVGGTNAVEKIGYAAAIDKFVVSNNKDFVPTDIKPTPDTVTYDVTLPEGCTSISGYDFVAKNTDFAFKISDNNWDYVFSATMGGNETTVTNNGDGTYTISNVTGELVISARKTGVAEARINSTYYSTLQAAITAADAATKPVEIDLLADVTSSGTIEINDGVTLDLNGYTLDMNNYYLNSDGDVVDNSAGKTGRLKVGTYAANEVQEGNELSIGTPKGKLAANNNQVPVYIANEGYMFATMLGQANVSKTDYSFTVISRPSFGTSVSNDSTTYHSNKLANGADAAKLQFIIRLEWTEDGTSYYQNLKYTDDLVKTVYGNSKAFSATVNGLTNYKNSMKVTVLVKSDLGVEWENNSFVMKETSGE